MLRLNCDAANKLIKQLTTDRQALLIQEAQASYFSYLQGEEPFKPDYDFTATQNQLDEYATKIAAIRHAVNEFNVKTVLPGLDITVDQALVMLPILTAEKDKLDRMRQSLPKTRVRSSSNGQVSEFRESNFAPKDAENRYRNVLIRLTDIQQALNTVNLTGEIFVDINI